MNTTDLQMPTAGRRRARYSDDFKRQVVAACREPGVSTAAVALANALNANMLRRWVVESGQHAPSDRPVRSSALPCVQTKAAFVPVKFDPPPAPPGAASADIRIELQHGNTAVQIHWPVQASSQCVQWLREVLA
jgi:transposase